MAIGESNENDSNLIGGVWRDVLSWVFNNCYDFFMMIPNMFNDLLVSLGVKEAAEAAVPAL